MGTFCLVLHTHLPYVRRNGVWPSGEDFFHQAAVESYLPLLGTFGRLAEAGISDALTLSISPMVAHQMRDPHLLRELDWYLGRWELRALRQVANYRDVFAAEFHNLAAFYARFGREQGERLDALSEGGIAAGFAALARAGVFEVLGGPATHPFLPRITEPVLARMQLDIGRAEHASIFGASDAGIWLPECAYEPGLEERLDGSGVSHVVIDGPTMLRSGGDTAAPRRIASSNVTAFARNLDVTYRVWSPTGGYPTGRWYRDFFHYDVEAGFKDWRVTSIKKPLEKKRPYEPEAGIAAARADAEDFALRIREAMHGRPDAVVLAAYDTELFGHWWFEGPTFLEHLFLVLRDMPDVEARSLSSTLATRPAPEPIDLTEGSWGFRKDDRSWVGADTDAMWKSLADIEHGTVRALEEGASGGRRAALEQLVREALLAQASDWPFMVIRGRNPEYAMERFEGHRARWQHMRELLRSHLPDDLVERQVRAVFEQDNILPTITL